MLLQTFTYNKHSGFAGEIRRLVHEVILNATQCHTINLCAGSYFDLPYPRNPGAKKKKHLEKFPHPQAKEARFS